MTNGEKKLGIWGWWHGNNLGDLWIKRTLEAQFPSAIFVESHITDLSPYDFVICGGGGLFIFDVAPPFTDVRSLPPFGVLGLGIEFPHPDKKAVALYKRSRFFFVRDRYSLDGMHLTKVPRSYDITFAAPLPWLSDDEIKTDRALYIWRDGKEWLSDPQFRSYLHYEECDSDWNRIVQTAFDYVRSDDFQTTDDGIDSRMDGIGFVVSGRYHGIVAAIQKGIPFIAIDVCPKIRVLASECGLEEYCVKINEYRNVPGLIEKARSDLSAIRKKELAFREEACKTINDHLQIVHSEIEKAFSRRHLFFIR